MALRDHPTVITLIRALDPARGLDHEPYAARVLGDAPDLARAHLRVRTRVGTRVRTRARARVIALAIDSALVLLGAEFVIRSEDVARASDQELRLVRVAVDDLRNDFTGADLRGLNLSGVELDGVRWSAATQWPPHSIDEVRRVSVEVSPGIFEVRGYGRLGDGMSVDPTWG